MTEAQIKYMVDGLLGWRPPNSPGGGISFKNVYKEHTAHPAEYEPRGTIFSRPRRPTTIRYLIDGLPDV